MYYELEKLGRQAQCGIGSLTMGVCVVCDAARCNLVGRQAHVTTVSMNLLLLFLGFCMKMEAICSFENLASICQITRRHNPDDNIFKIVVGIFKISSNFRPTVREKLNKNRKYTYKQHRSAFRSLRHSV